MKILNGCGIEVAIPSIANPTYTSCVVKSREAERFVNEIRDLKKSELHTELQGPAKNEPCEERQGRSRNKETCANSFSNPPQRASLYTQRTIPTSDRKWKVTHAASSDGGYSATAVSKMGTQMLRHYDQEERQTDGSRHWDTIRPTLVRAFAREEARDFDDGYWLKLIHEGSNKMRIEYCVDKNGFVRVNPTKVRTGHSSDTCTTHHSTPTCTARVGALIWSHPGDWITPVGPGRTPTVHWRRYEGRPWVAQPHEHARTTQVTDTRVEHRWCPH